MKTKRKEESYDYSGFDRFFEERSDVSSVIKRLMEMRTSYLEMTLCLEKQVNIGNDTEAFPHNEAIAHSELIGDIIAILETIASENDAEEETLSETEKR